MILRDYQDAAIQQARDYVDQGFHRIIIHSGTGTGKTVIAAAITRSAIDFGHQVLFLAHRRELIDQAWRKLVALGLTCSVIMATDKRYNPAARVHVASVATLVNRPHIPNVQLIIVDECHRALASTYQQVLESYPGSIVLGLTATPCRSDLRPLGDLFEVMASCPSVGHMMRAVDPATGKPYLVGTRVFAPESVDLTGVQTQNGDYKPNQLAAVCDKPKIIGSIVEHWQKLAENRRTIVFAAGVMHSEHIVSEFLSNGIAAEHLDGTTDKELRAAILARLLSGETRIVSNVGVLTEGFDCPPVACIVLGCPTKSLVKYLQMVGRALRPFPGKEDCLILDHANATAMHGFVDDERIWSLEAPVRNAVAERDKSMTTCCVPVEGLDGTITKYPCFRMFPAGPKTCPFCGCPVPQPEGRDIETVPGQLQEIVRHEAPPLWDGWDEKIQAAPLVIQTPAQFWQSQVRLGRKIAGSKGYSPNWGVHFAQRAFFKKYDEHPPLEWVTASRIEDKKVRVEEAPGLFAEIFRTR